MPSATVFAAESGRQIKLFEIKILISKPHVHKDLPLGYSYQALATPLHPGIYRDA
jgi:hypothetical protein